MTITVTFNVCGIAMITLHGLRDEFVDRRAMRAGRGNHATAENQDNKATHKIVTVAERRVIESLYAIITRLSASL
ncbi:MAG: hypothetical protein ACR2KU_04480 [Gammaproteobacteria bacterium]